MKNLKIKLTIIGISLLSLNVFAQDYVYQGVKDVEATIGMNQTENDSGQETVSANCYDPANIGKRISAQGCDDLLIVDNDSLRQMIRNDQNYSDTNIFTGQVTDMSFLFCNFNTTGYPQCTLKEPIYSISNWNTENVTNMYMMFYEAKNFNQPLNSWNMSSVTNMFSMFYMAFNFNQPLNNWDVSNVTNMQSVFSYADKFNQPLDNWDVSNVENMKSMFSNATSFNQPLDNWDVSNVKNMHSMFFNSIYNQPLNNWDVSNVTNMYSMFRRSSYNQSLNNWNLSSVTNMGYMFYNANLFNQDISDWCIPTISTKPARFDENSSFENQTQLQPNWGCN